MRIHHPRDWAQLIRSVGKKDKFFVTEMDQNDFFDFSSFYKQELQIKTKNCDNDKFIWHDVQWIRYQSDQIGIMKYKNSVDIDEPFKNISFLRRRRENPILKPKCQYTAVIPISEEKKKDLLSILHLVDPLFHDFYKNLPTSSVASINEVESEESQE